jgi:hypothetical protein
MGRNSLFKTVFNAAAAADAQVVRAALDISPPFDIGRKLFAPKYTSDLNLHAVLISQSSGFL